MRDPLWWALHALGATPVVGQLWWLLVFGMHDRADEGRLSDFVVSFGASSFVSVGLVSLLGGSLSLLACSAWLPPTMPCDDAALPSPRWLLSLAASRALGGGAGPAAGALQCPSCAVYGPRASLVDAVFFVMQVSLVWTAFGLLPYTTRLVPGRDGRAPVPKRPPPTHASALLHPWYGTLPRKRGGELAGLFWYFSAVTLASAAAVAVLLLLGGVNWRTLATAYWVRCAFGLLGLPFVLFKIPVVGPMLLLRSDATGYDRQGRVVSKAS